jgi:hypothetical protein
MGSYCLNPDTENGDSTPPPTTTKGHKYSFNSHFINYYNEEDHYNFK